MFFSAILITAAAMAWLAWTGIDTRNQIRAASQRAVRVAELRGTIAYLDEWLTMSAQMAAASGERLWADRYEEAAPKLDAAIGEAADLASPEVRAALGRTTDEAHRDLVLMERRALGLAADGDLAAARALLGGPEFAYLKDVYASGIEEFGADLNTLATSRASDLNDRAWMEAAGLGLIAILLVSTALTVRTQSRLRRAAARTAAMARTDALTDLPNRRRFYEELEAALAAKPAGCVGYALLLIDLDRFRAANDAYGHAAGDELLRLVAARLKTIVRIGDLIARLSGDEFAIVLPLASDQSQTSNDPAQVARRVLSVLSEPFALGEGTLAQIGGSVGVAYAQPEDDRGGELMHRAEVALYRAKADGRGCVRYFEPTMDDHVRARALLESELRQAVADDTIVPYFQPLIEIQSGRLIGVEMLARWPHPHRGMVSPAEFIPIAEELGLIGAMTHHLLQRACRDAASWPAHMTLACNVSPVQLRDPNLSGMVRDILDETGFAPSRLVIEVTESALVGDLKLARTLLDELKGLGVRLALDDFGTGYSGLRHLHLLPFDKLKIDASFVGAMTDDRESRKIVAAVVGLGQSLGLSVVAEGVETEETLALLRTLGCDIGQGWLFGRPGPADRIDAMILEAGGAPEVRLAS